MMSALGDRRGRELLREHERITRDALQSHDGTEIKTLGDGFMASFTRITDALACAVDLQQRFTARNASVESADEPPLEVRIGINAGEPIEEDGDLFGATVILASRIAGAAQGQEVLVSNAVRELSVGNDFVFHSRGTFEAKGFDDPIHIWEVDWRARSPSIR
jgi:class 3 adenylate cyclase